MPFTGLYKKKRLKNQSLLKPKNYFNLFSGWDYWVAAAVAAAFVVAAFAAVLFAADSALVDLAAAVVVVVVGPFAFAG